MPATGANDLKARSTLFAGAGAIGPQHAPSRGCSQ
jgi:hypothetical protein